MRRTAILWELFVTLPSTAHPLVSTLYKRLKERYIAKSAAAGLRRQKIAG
jgi:hypothetical protein